MTNEEELKKNYVFLLEMLNNAEDTPFQSECYLSCIERFLSIYVDDETLVIQAVKHHAILLNLYIDKFKIEINYEA